MRDCKIGRNAYVISISTSLTFLNASFSKLDGFSRVMAQTMWNYARLCLLLQINNGKWYLPYHITSFPVTFEVTQGHQKKALSNVIFRAVVQQTTRFQLIQRVTQSLETGHTLQLTLKYLVVLGFERSSCSFVFRHEIYTPRSEVDSWKPNSYVATSYMLID